MKRKVLFILLALGLVAMVSAQGKERQGRTPGMGPSNRPAAETVTVSGSLIVANGSPALKSGDVTYIVGGLNRLVGFVDGLKEGAQVTVEGSAFTSPRDSNLKFLKSSKLTLNGKAYDLSSPVFPFGFSRQFGPPPGGLHRRDPRVSPRQFNRSDGQGRQGRSKTL